MTCSINLILLRNQIVINKIRMEYNTRWNVLVVILKSGGVAPFILSLIIDKVSCQLHTPAS
jgi:hypothetical protein